METLLNLFYACPGRNSLFMPLQGEYEEEFLRGMTWTLESSMSFPQRRTVPFLESSSLKWLLYCCAHSSQDSLLVGWTPFKNTVFCNTKPCYTFPQINDQLSLAIITCNYLIITYVFPKYLHLPTSSPFDMWFNVTSNHLLQLPQNWHDIIAYLCSSKTNNLN